jgi:thioester reductase-like protein
MPNLCESGAACRVLLTGATGFLGAHLLRELLEESTTEIVCPVRAGDDEAAEARLWQQLNWYFPDWPSGRAEQRVRAVAADLTLERFGVSARVYSELAETTSVVVNAAADVRHVGHRGDFFRINTDAVGKLVELCRHGREKHLHHVSTVAVKGRFPGAAPMPAFTEAHLEEGQGFTDHPYAESKYQAEILLRDAVRNGTRATVYRVGNVGPHSVTGCFQKNIEDSAFAAYVWSCIRLGFAPYRPETRLRLMPVDSMARAIALLGRAESKSGRTFHIEHSREVSHYDVIRVLQAFGYPIRVTSEREFAENAAALAEDDETLAIVLQTATAEARGAVPVNSDFSLRELSRLGFECPPVSALWLQRFLEHATQVGFLKPPPFTRHFNLPPLAL